MKVQRPVVADDELELLEELVLEELEELELGVKVTFVMV